MTAWPVLFEDVIQAETRLRAYFPPSPLRNYADLDAATGVRLLIKHENHLPTCAFKVRNNIACLTSVDRHLIERGVVGASTGNHGQGLAWAARALGVPATICVPLRSNPEKLAAMRALGARLVEEGEDFDAALAVMRRLVKEEGLYEVHGVNHPRMPVGAGTAALEAVRQAEAMAERIDAAVYSVGGGSQAVGGMTVLRALRPAAQVFAVQAQGAATIHDAWHRVKAGGNLQREIGLVGPPVQTIAEGLATRSAYALTFPALCEGLSGFVTVTDAEMAQAVRLLLRVTHNLVEPAGAAGVAAVLKLRPKLEGKTVLVQISGANLSLEQLRRVVNGEI